MAEEFVQFPEHKEMVETGWNLGWDLLPPWFRRHLIHHYNVGKKNWDALSLDQRQTYTDKLSRE